PMDRPILARGLVHLGPRANPPQHIYKTAHGLDWATLFLWWASLAWPSWARPSQPGPRWAYLK
ncbi:hypothetical protein PanWU01x14_300480, partial [Parasponia andersonii]